MDSNISQMTLDELKELLDELKKRCFIMDDPTTSKEELDNFNELFDNVVKKIDELS